MKILAIETSCDETAFALVEGVHQGSTLIFKVEKAALLSQAALHAQYGGVYPNLAKREHEKNLPVLYREFVDEKFDAIAVTHGPGLEPALWQGIEFGKRIAAEKGVPLLPVNHMEGHLISSLAKKSEGEEYKLENIKLPVLGLLISGGHTEFVLMEDWFTYKIIGKTLDDAVGECFDKVARMLGLPYPGGPEISKHASTAREQNLKSEITLPRPMMQSSTCDVSFSGLKTAALYALRDRNLSEDEKKAFAREFEDTVGDVFVSKTRRALKETNAKTFVIGGGVAANNYLRERLQKLLADEFPEVEVRLPELSITGDNAIMIAEAALAHLLRGDWNLENQNGAEIRAIGNLSIAQKVL